MSNTPTAKKATTAPKKAKPTPVVSKPKLEVGATSKDGLWKIESFRERDSAWIVVGTKLNINFYGRVGLDEEAAIKIMGL